MSDKTHSGMWKKWDLEDLGREFSTLEPEMIEPIRPEETDDEAWEEELSRLRQSAQSKGFEQGLAEGREEGLTAGKQQGYDEGLAQGKQEGLEQGLAEARAQQQEILDRLKQFSGEFLATLEAADKIMPAQIMQIAMSAAQYVVDTTPVCNNDALLKRIQKLMHGIPLLNGEPQLCVHPDDLMFIKEHLGEICAQQQWKLVADASVGKGGCRVSGENGEIDATMEARWRMLCSLAMEEIVP